MEIYLEIYLKIYIFNYRIQNFCTAVKKIIVPKIKTMYFDYIPFWRESEYFENLRQKDWFQQSYCCQAPSLISVETLIWDYPAILYVQRNQDSWWWKYRKFSRAQFPHPQIWISLIFATVPRELIRFAVPPPTALRY